MFTNLAIGFIGIALLVVMIDTAMLFFQRVMNMIPKLPDEFEWSFAYACIVGISYLIVWRAHFSFFDYLNFSFANDWEGYLLTAIMISGGSFFIKKQWDLVSYIPSGVYGITAKIRDFIPAKRSTVTTNETTVEYQDFSAPSPSTPNHYDNSEVLNESVDTGVDYNDSNRYKEI